MNPFIRQSHERFRLVRLSGSEPHSPDVWPCRSEVVDTAAHTHRIALHPVLCCTVRLHILFLLTLCVVLHCIEQCCTLFYGVFHCPMPHYTVLHIILLYIPLYHTTLYNVVHYFCGVFHCPMPHCTVLHIILLYIPLYHTTLYNVAHYFMVYSTVPYHIVLCCTLFNRIFHCPIPHCTVLHTI